MNKYIFNDKVIDDQGNVKTVAGGQDARLYYLDINGNRLKYLLEGEAQGGEDSAVTSVNGMTGDVQLDLYKIDYESYSGNDIKLEANKYFTNTNALTSIELNITNINNAMCVFKTGDTVSFTVSVPENMLVNKAFNFEANKNYIIAVDNGIVFWSEVVAAN